MHEAFSIENCHRRSVHLNPTLSLASAEHPGDGLPGDTSKIREFLVSEGHGEPLLGLFAGAVAAEIKQDRCKTADSRRRQRKRVRVEERGLVVLRKDAGGVHVRLSVATKERKELIPPNVLDGRWLESFGGHLMATARDDRSQPEHITRHGDVQDNCLPFPRCAVKFDLTFVK